MYHPAFIPALPSLIYKANCPLIVHYRPSSPFRSLWPCKAYLVFPTERVEKVRKCQLTLLLIELGSLTRLQHNPRSTWKVLTPWASQSTHSNVIKKQIKTSHPSLIWDSQPCHWLSLEKYQLHWIWSWLLWNQLLCLVLNSPQVALDLPLCCQIHQLPVTTRGVLILEMFLKRRQMVVILMRNVNLTLMRLFRGQVKLFTTGQISKKISKHTLRKLRNHWHRQKSISTLSSQNLPPFAWKDKHGCKPALTSLINCMKVKGIGLHVEFRHWLSIIRHLKSSQLKSGWWQNCVIVVVWWISGETDQGLAHLSAHW